MSRWAAAIALVSVLATGGRARACATCACGDLTLTLMGSEKPFAGRLRGALELRHRTDAVGAEGVDEMRLQEERLDAQLVWAPLDRFIVMADVPALRREVTYVNLATRETIALGDVQITAKTFVYQDDSFVPSHLLAVLASLKVPTAQVQRGPDGALLPVELQPGTGSFDPGAGLAYSFFADPWSFYASLTGIWTTTGDQGLRAPRSLRSTTALQYQLMPSLALRGGVDTRTDGTALEGGLPAPDSGGFIGFATLETLFSPVSDWLLYAALRVPVLNALKGEHTEGPYLTAGAAYDFF